MCSSWVYVVLHLDVLSNTSNKCSLLGSGSRIAQSFHEMMISRETCQQKSVKRTKDEADRAGVEPSVFAKQFQIINVNTQ